MRITVAGLGGALLLASAAIALSGNQADQVNQTDRERFIGTWRIAKAVGDGTDMATDMRELARIVFTKDGKAMLTLAGHSKDEGEYKISGQGQLELNLGDRKEKELYPSIYKFEGDDRLFLCFNDDPSNDKRPTEFLADKGSGQVLFVLERAKQGEEKPTAAEMNKHKELADKISETPARTKSTDNLSEIGRAIYFYYDVHKTLPPHAIYGKDKTTPLLSWRVAILPHINHETLYKEFNLNEPWDSPHNKKLIAKMPVAYEAVGLGKKEEGMTYYQVFTGPDTLFDGPKQLRFDDIRDGTAQTILVIEGAEPVIWTKPADLKLPKEKDKMPAVGGLFNDRTHVLFCDAHVFFLTRQTPPNILRALVTPNGGEKVDMNASK